MALVNYHRWQLPFVCFLLLLMQDPSGEAGAVESGPLTQHKKVRCYSENVKVGDDRNYEIEKIRKDEDTIESIERSGRSADCVVHTEITNGGKNLTAAKDIDVPPPSIQPFDNFNLDIHIPDTPSDITRLDNSKPTGGFDNHNIQIPISNFGPGIGIGGGYDIPKNPPNLINDYAGRERQEYGGGEEKERSYGSATSVRRQESYDHQEYSNEKSRTLPGWRPGWGGGGGGGEAADDPRWRINYETSANDINEVNKSAIIGGDLLLAALLQVVLFYVLY